jgi:two-component sensor histidine kinase
MSSRPLRSRSQLTKQLTKKVRRCIHSVTISVKLLHRVNNYLQHIMGLIELSLISNDDTARKKLLESAKKECSGLSRMLDEHVKRQAQEQP